MDIYVDKYQDNLIDIVKRIEIISEIIDKKLTTTYINTNTEFVCLQFRKIIESIVFCSLIVNEEEYSNAHEKFSKHYNARLIVSDLKRVNPNYFPVPVTQEVIQNDSGRTFVLKNVEEGFLTENDLLNIYEKCGSYLHQENPFSQKRNYISIQEEFPIWLSKIIILLNNHYTKCFGNKFIFHAILRYTETGLPHVSKLLATEVNLK
jgi:hypothetical protein